MSGIGKTSLAVGYLLDRADIYDVIFWVDAESEQTLTFFFLTDLPLSPWRRLVRAAGPSASQRYGSQRPVVYHGKIADNSR